MKKDSVFEYKGKRKYSNCDSEDLQSFIVEYHLWASNKP